MVRILAVAALVLIAIYAAVSYMIYDKLSRATYGGGDDAGNTPALFINRYKDWTSFDETPYFMQDYEKVRFPSRQAGLSLAGWYVPGRPGAPVVLLTHGFNDCKCKPNVLTAAGMLHRNGFNVLLYDMRDHGESDIEDGRAAIGNEEYQDVLGAWDWLIAEKHYAPAQIGFYGQSLGAGTTLMAFGQEPRVAAAFVDSPFADLPQIITEELARNNYPTLFTPGTILMARIVAGDDLVAHSPQDAIRTDAGRPIYIVHGTGDERINVHHTQQLADLAAKTGANVTVWLPAGIGHVDAEFALPVEYEQRLVSFFEAALKH
jgi:dipeptidyl aminopeptidase/acylaminoacyl peptidase